MTEELSIREKQLLFKLRSRVTPNKTNYRKKYEHDLSCTLCKDPNTEESESHLLSCPFLINKHQLGPDMQTIQYEDIFKNLTHQVKAVKVWTKIFKIYEKENPRWRNFLKIKKIILTRCTFHLGDSYNCYVLHLYDIGFKYIYIYLRFQKRIGHLPF